VFTEKALWVTLFRDRQALPPASKDAMKTPTAALLVIGNEVLCGRTADKNIPFIAAALTQKGIALQEVRVVADVESAIVDAVNTLRSLYTYLFTTGGIGPTHDDITTACVAKACGVLVRPHPEALAALKRHYTADDLNAARLKMAEIPEGATLIANPVSAAPGFRLHNIFVMAGVPRIMQAMLDNVLPTLEEGAPVHSITFSTQATEGQFATLLANVQAEHEGVMIGSYPFFQQGKIGVSLVLRSTDQNALVQAKQAVEKLLTPWGYNVT
jgi:molybdenum cofactor synthesis domain-containing protein